MGTHRRVRPGSCDASETLVVGAGESPVLLTCEHASERLPPPWVMPPQDAWLRGLHWAYDPGAAELTRELAAAWGAVAVLARFSRLLADPNRPAGSRELIRARAEGRRVVLNEAVDEAERGQRVERLWRPYHQAVDAALGASAAPVICSIHSFTPVYQGAPRGFEIGVLFDEAEAFARALAEALAAAGFSVALNEPYSGKHGMMYSADHHARARGRTPLELEVRQDRIVDPAFRARLVRAMGFLRDAAPALGGA